jgi:hypothetical protein
MKTVLASFAFVVAATAGQAEPHACAADAIAKADQILRFHGEVQSGQPATVDQNVKVLPPRPITGCGSSMRRSRVHAH